eukprot:14701734-Heterocapsa_arctica.AAC.1
MKSRDAFNAVIALDKASQIEPLLDILRSLQYRLDYVAAAAPLMPAQVTAPTQTHPTAASGSKDGQPPIPSDGGGGGPTGAGKSGPSGTGP